jgi:hypothetical protein
VDSPIDKKRGANGTKLLSRLARVRARNARAIDSGARMAASVHCKLDGVLSSLMVFFRRTIQFVLRDKRYGADERDK